jgi:hypothetical protein
MELYIARCFPFTYLSSRKKILTFPGDDESNKKGVYKIHYGHYKLFLIGKGTPRFLLRGRKNDERGAMRIT